MSIFNRKNKSRLSEIRWTKPTSDKKWAQFYYSNPERGIISGDYAKVVVVAKVPGGGSYSHPLNMVFGYPEFWRQYVVEFDGRLFGVYEHSVKLSATKPGGKK